MGSKATPSPVPPGPHDTNLAQDIRIGWEEFYFGLEEYFRTTLAMEIA